MVNRYYSIYEAERGKTSAELRAADVQIGEFVAELAQLGSALAAPVRAARRSLRRWRPVVLPDQIGDRWPRAHHGDAVATGERGAKGDDTDAVA
jgi:hypothetical protein